jgi:predicted amidohydrolase YtcJ
MGLILRRVEVGGSAVDVRVDDGLVVEIAARLRPRPSDAVVDGDGGALIAGLHDHHIHVLALAAARRSVEVGPANAPSRSAFIAALQDAATRGPVRAVGYHESVFGPLDRDALDTILPDIPARVQHRSGGLWILNSRAIAAIDAIEPDRLADARFERDHTGRHTGRLWRGDDLVRAPNDVPSVTEIGTELAAAGVTSITDATATNDGDTVERLRELPQRVRVMGRLGLDVEATPRLVLGEVKILLDDEGLPDLDDTIALVREAHQCARAVAVHCVTLVQLRFAIEVFRVAGVRADRIEHASVAPSDAINDLHVLGLSVVTQPAFVATRGDQYLQDVDPRDVDALYPVASLLSAGVLTRGSSDAPYGPADPWEAIRAAIDRRTARGIVVGPAERIRPAPALALFGDPDAVRVGANADLVLLEGPLQRALRHPSRDQVVATVIGGDIVHDAR